MSLVVVGGSTRNIGKTSVVAGLIAALPAKKWTAVKITQYGHGVCSADGAACECATADHTVAFSEERDRSGKSDSSRYLLAGAQRSLWVRTQQGELLEAMPRLRNVIASAENVILESNSILKFLKPDVYISVLDPTMDDLKGSARRYLDRADLIVMPQPGQRNASWFGELHSILRRIPTMRFDAGTYANRDLADFVAGRLKESESMQQATF